MENINCCEIHIMALTEVLWALLIFLHVGQYSEKFYRTQFLISHSWENLSLHVKKVSQQIKKYFSRLTVGNETSITNKCSEMRKNKKKPLFFNCMHFLSWLIITDYLQVATLISATPYSDFKVIHRRFPQWKCRQGTSLQTQTGNERKTVKVRGKKVCRSYCSNNCLQHTRLADN